MWLRIAILATAATACTPAGFPQSPLPAEEVRICQVDLRFATVDSRSAFLRNNSSAILRASRDQQAFFISGGTDGSISIYTQLPMCDGLSLDQRYNLRGADALASNHRLLAAAEENAALGKSPRSEALDVNRKCVVRFAALSDENVGLIISTLPYSGLHGVQTLALDDQVYVATDEECDLTSHYVSSVLSSVYGEAGTNIIECANSSLLDCGFPYTVNR